MSISVTYALGETFAGSGIGRIAGHAAAGAYRASLLDRVVTWETGDPAVPAYRIVKPPLGSVWNLCPFPYPKDLAFDLFCERKLGSPDVFHGWRNMALRSIRRAKDRGAVTVIDGASTHPHVQKRLVEEEYRRFDVDRELMGRRHFERAVAELAECDYVFVPSDFVLDSFLEVGFDRDELVKIPFGVDIDQFTPPDDLARSGREFQTVFVGQISLRKGIQYLLPAWQQANVEGQLLLAGQVTDTAKEFVEPYRDDPSIRFLGWVDDMPRLFRDASVFAFPSVEEGSALVSYEAMASGLPAIVTPNVGSLVEDGEHGVVVKPRDVDAVADAIERLAGDPDERARMGRAARETVEAYTWERYGDRVTDTYRRIAPGDEG